ncbi:MAG TPA: hypothetical protein IAA29_11950 [Candidatus Paenibacillus intestinavium]|nr:hypothetical protein [Candidatus Paenibacillus intestinavium]
MAELIDEQVCPYCDRVEEDYRSHWDNDSTTVNCSFCDKEYHVTAHYKFLGFETQKICDECGSVEDECFCEIDEGED